MAVTVDCGEGKHALCTGSGRTAYLFPQESRSHDEPPFDCGCRCHHDGREGSVPCAACAREDDDAHMHKNGSSETS